MVTGVLACCVMSLDMIGQMQPGHKCSVRICRLVTDRETGRQKGFGFCEYYDKDTAQSAIRNLGGHEVNGRHLRVDCTDASNEKGDRSMTLQSLLILFACLQHCGFLFQSACG